MKLRISSSIILFALSIPAFAIPAPAPILAPGKIYVGVFAGGASSNQFGVSQYGTAFYSDINGGPLAVNAFGQLNSESASVFGAQLGYQAQEIQLGSNSPLTVGPAVELEGYSLSSSTFNGGLTNNTARLPAHDFVVSYPMSRSVFLVNAVINFNHPRLVVHPYVGLGIGSAIVRISGADATQVIPAEAGVNHYNANYSDATSVFAGQIKLGLSYDINTCVSVFADYRWLYIASTRFVFGSTVYPTHVETSSWQVSLDPQRYNMGSAGIRFNFA